MDSEPYKHKVICDSDHVVTYDNEEECWRIKPTVISWLQEYITVEQMKGTDSVTWHMSNLNDNVVLSFVDPEMAMMFKLAWGGRA